MKDGEITLSIVSHGHGLLIERLLDDLSRLGGTAFADIIVTLNLHGEAFEPQAWPALPITVRRNETPLGFGTNHNRAFAQCQSRWFAVLNPDLRLPEDPFSILSASAAAVPQLGVIAPRIEAPNGALEDSVREHLTPLSLLGRALNRQSGRADVPPNRAVSTPDAGFFWLAGMFMFFPAEAFRTIGGFDERYHLYCEDYDICARLHLGGYAIAVQPAARAVHDAQRDSHRSPRHLLWHMGSLLRTWASGAFWAILLNRRSARRRE